MDAVEYIVGKHREMEALLSQLEEADDPHRRTELLRDITAELARHMAVEERILFPAVRRELQHVDPETFGDDVLENLEEHHVLKLILDELHDMDPSHERFPAKAEVLAETVEHHHEEEEGGVLAGIREHWDDARRATIGRELEAAEASAPTRPHPNLPDEGRLVATVQRFAAAIDRARDAVRDTTDTLRP